MMYDQEFIDSGQYMDSLAINYDTTVENIIYKEIVDESVIEQINKQDDVTITIIDNVITLTNVENIKESFTFSTDKTKVEVTDKFNLTINHTPATGNSVEDFEIDIPVIYNNKELIFTANFHDGECVKSITPDISGIIIIPAVERINENSQRSENVKVTVKLDW